MEEIVMEGGGKREGERGKGINEERIYWR